MGYGVNKHENPSTLIGRFLSPFFFRTKRKGVYFYTPKVIRLIPTFEKETDDDLPVRYIYSYLSGF